MNALLRDMYAHQEWADAEHWRAVGAFEAAREHARLRERLFHVHQVQRMFVWAVGDRATRPVPVTLAELPGFDNLRNYARESHDRIRAMIAGLTDDHLASTITMPWFPPPPCALTVESALAQMAMHSHYHRGQNSLILRELGGEPPTTDLIVWHWKGRPEPGW